MLEDIKARLSGDVNYGTWNDLNDFVYEKGWIWDAHVSDRNASLIRAAQDDDRPDLLIPVALSMVPEGWGLGIGRECNAGSGRGFLTDGDRSFDRAAQYPAAALALAVIEVREVGQ